MDQPASDLRRGLLLYSLNNLAVALRSIGKRAKKINFNRWTQIEVVQKCEGWCKALKLLNTCKVKTEGSSYELVELMENHNQC